MLSSCSAAALLSSFFAPRSVLPALLLLLPLEGDHLELVQQIIRDEDKVQREEEHAERLREGEAAAQCREVDARERA